MCVIRIVLYYFDMWLYLVTIIDTILHSTFVLFVFVCVSRHFAIQGSFRSAYIGSSLIFIAVLVTHIIRPPL